MTNHEEERYSVLCRVAQIGNEGHKILSQSRAVVIGVGALGSSIAHQLVRSGVGKVLLVDSDRVELSNLHRQILYTENDVAQSRLKAEAAAQYLTQANSTVDIESIPKRFTAKRAHEILQQADIVLDGTDNLESRYLINEECVKRGIPWVYGGITGTYGMVMPVIPQKGPCLRCIFREDPPSEETSVAETAGVLGATPAVIGAFQAAQAIRILVGDCHPPFYLLSIDLWTQDFDRIAVKQAVNCPTCGTTSGVSS